MKKTKRLTKGQKDYMEKLRDPRWQKVRLLKLEAAGWKCEWCGSAKKNLQIEHGYYSRGLEPWEYPPESLWVLCADCHKTTESAKAEMSAVQSRIPPWHHHHVYYYMLELKSALDDDEELEAQAPLRLNAKGEFEVVAKKNAA